MTQEDNSDYFDFFKLIFDTDDFKSAKEWGY